MQVPFLLLVLRAWTDGAVASSVRKAGSSLAAGCEERRACAGVGRLAGAQVAVNSIINRMLQKHSMLCTVTHVLCDKKMGRI